MASMFIAMLLKLDALLSRACQVCQCLLVRCFENLINSTLLLSYISSQLRKFLFLKKKLISIIFYGLETSQTIRAQVDEVLSSSCDEQSC